MLGPYRWSEKEPQMLELILAGMGGALIVDARGRISYVSENFQALASWPREDIIGRPVEEVFPGSRISEVLHNGKHLVAEVWTIKGRPHYMTCLPLLDEGQITGVMAVSAFRSHREALAVARRILKLDSAMKDGEDGRGLEGAKYSLDGIIGESEGILEVKERVVIIADSKVPVLIQGDTGTGKELVAHALHQESSRRNGPFIRVNCASIPESLIESELFGYDEGAFTGARKGGKPGKFEQANGGSIFLDEVSELSRTAQAKLLRTLQENEIERVGSTRLIPIDARVISASNQALTSLVEEGKFRKDLMFRLAVFNIYIPPLRQRPEDIPVLCQHFIEQYNAENGTNINGISDDGMDFLQAYHWPGNVRELMIAVERACLDAEHEQISLKNILRYLGIGRGQFLKNYSYPGFDLKAARQEAEKATIQRALAAAEGNRPKAASLLGISRSALYYKMTELGINKSSGLSRE